MYVDDYPTCEAAYVALEIVHADLDPDIVSKRMGLVPSTAWKRGDLCSVPSGTPAVALEGAWIIRSPDELNSRDIRRLLDWLLDLTEPRAEIVRQLRAEGYRALVSCEWVSYQGRGGPTVSVRNMSRLASLGLALKLDLYAPSEE